MPKGQIEAGHALGLGRPAALFKIVLPQVYRFSLPAIGNEVVLVLKGSTLASAVTVMEMTGAARGFVTRTYAPFETFLIAGVIYLLLGTLFGHLSTAFETRFFIPGR